MVFGRNVKARLEGEKLILEIDLSKKAIVEHAQRSKSDKDVYVVASTQGFKDALNDVKVSLNAIIPGRIYRALTNTTGVKPAPAPTDAEKRIRELEEKLAKQNALVEKLLKVLEAKGQG